MYYTSNYDGNNTPAFVIVGNPIVLSSNNYIIYADGKDMTDAIYPVGSLYWSSKSTNPSSLFGGTWVQIKDRFVLACGDTYKTVGATGGASSVTLSVSNIPSHYHSFSWSGTTGVMNRNSSGSWGVRVSNSKNSGDGADRYTPSTSGNVSVNMSSYIRTLAQRPTDDYKASREHWFTMDLSHEHTYSGSGTTSSEGSGTSFSILPPYVVKYCWERTA